MKLRFYNEISHNVHGSHFSYGSTERCHGLTALGGKESGSQTEGIIARYGKGGYNGKALFMFSFLLLQLKNCGEWIVLSDRFVQRS